MLKQSGIILVILQSRKGLEPMKKIHKKTLEDLEFYTVVEQLSKFAVTNLGKAKTLEIAPITDRDLLLKSLDLTNEYLASFYNDNRIPNHGFDEISRDLQLLKIENSSLETEGFRKISAITITSEGIIKFLKKFKDYYPELFAEFGNIETSKLIIEEIDSVVSRHGEIKDEASKELYNIRHSINDVRSKINSSFNHALTTYSSNDYLDDIKESVIENKRVLAVTAMHRRKVKGNIMGSSKTGSIVYIQPEATFLHARELNNLEFEEGEEISKILKQLTERVRPFRPLLREYQEFLVELDVIYSKAKYAQSVNAISPKINDEKRLFIRDAYHPLLYLNNKKKGLKTFPQTIELYPESRIIVISGPNAGGKSITLKTVGLLQLMLQSGMLVPVHEKSSMCFFSNVLSDIGDNQSIENHLSTYSYRLKQMNYFLKKCDKNSLFLIDEFGTGSDPELGGALAETFLEVFYEREAFGIITTHYSNLKVLANELPHMLNANMMFDEKSLEPIYKLGLGQPGSSFTFEVAQKNGIPFSLINKSKKKIEVGKVRFDATIAKLQKERSKLQKTEESLRVNEQKKMTETEKLEETNQKIQKKLESYQELYDNNQRLIYLGQKVEELGDNYLENKSKKQLMAELFKLIQIENSKKKKVSVKEKRQQKFEEKKLNSEANKKIAVIREKKQRESKKVKEVKPKPILKIGDRVRLLDGKAVGSINTIEKNKAVVNYGMFTTNVSMDQLELVEAVKK
ncbi:DNA mismatch repair protein MutS2 [Flavobacteriaceae bacterium MAR_2010_188]|nr:DNA mismatch repair protein MutS2 [Flavobacteriaceae bacterium MAR_2010_188]